MGPEVPESLTLGTCKINLRSCNDHGLFKRTFKILTARTFILENYYSEFLANLQDTVVNEHQVFILPLMF